MMQGRRVSRAFVATCLIAVAHVVTAPAEHLKSAIGEALLGIAAAVSGGATREKKKENAEDIQEEIVFPRSKRR